MHQTPRLPSLRAGPVLGGERGSRFARPGHESRHNGKYWDDAPFRGFGMSAHSYRLGRRWWNADSFGGYCRALEMSGAAIVGERQLSAREHIGEALFTGLAPPRRHRPRGIRRPLRRRSAGRVRDAPARSLCCRPSGVCGVPLAPHGPRRLALKLPNATISQSGRSRPAPRCPEPRSNADGSRRFLPPARVPHRQGQSHHGHRTQARHPGISNPQGRDRLPRPGRRRVRSTAPRRQRSATALPRAGPRL